MKAYLKTILAVASGVAGASGGAVTLALTKTNEYELSAGGGNLALASSNSADTTQENTTPNSPEDITTDSSVGEQSPPQTIKPIPVSQNNEQSNPVETIKEEEENCKIIDFSGWDDVFYYLIDDSRYVMISCSETGKDTGGSLPNKWTGLFPENLLSNKEKGNKFRLTTETSNSSENITVTFSSKVLSSSSLEGRIGSTLQAEGWNFQVQEVNLKTPPLGKIFLVLVDDIEFLKQKLVTFNFNPHIN